MQVIDPLNGDFWIKIGTAVLCGSIVGFERQIRNKPAGIRTSILICLGTLIYVVLGAAVQHEHADPARVIGQIITGIGFLGAGVIMAREGLVRGITSAAVIWMLSAIGSTIGMGFIYSAIVLSLVTVGILTGVELLENTFGWLKPGAYMREEQKKKKRDFEE